MTEHFDGERAYQSNLSRSTKKDIETQRNDFIPFTLSFSFSFSLSFSSNVNHDDAVLKEDRYANLLFHSRRHIRTYDLNFLGAPMVNSHEGNLVKSAKRERRDL